MVVFESLISKYAIPNSIKRGRILYQKRKVVHLKASKNGVVIHCEAVVVGSSGTYKTLVEIENDVLTQSQCTCPFNWDGICKHRVATILTLEKQLLRGGELKKEPSEKRRNTREPFEIQLNHGELTPFHDHQKLAEAHSLTWTIRKVLVEENKIVVEIPKSHWNDYGSITIAVSEDFRSIFTTLYPPKHVKELSREELAALLYLQKKDLKRVLQLTSKEKRNELMLTEARRYGIHSLEQARQYFEIDTLDFKSPVKQKPGQPHMLLPSGQRGDSTVIKSYFTDEAFQERSFLTKELKGQDQRELSFYLTKKAYDNPYGLLSIVPFVARRKNNGKFYKTGIKNYFELGYHEPFDLTESQATIVDICQATEPSEFHKRFGNAIRKIDDPDDEKVFIYRQNLEYLQSFWRYLRKSEKKVYSNDFVHGTRILADGLVEIRLMHERPAIVMELFLEEGMMVFAPFLKFDAKKYRLDAPELEWIHPLCFKIGLQYFLLGRAEDGLFLHTVFGEHKSYMVVQEAFHTFFEEVVSPVSKKYPVQILGLPENLQQEHISMEITAKKLYLKELDKFILMRPFLCYGEYEANVLEDEGGIVMAGNKLISYERNLEKEQELVAQIKQLHSKFEKGTNHNFFSLHIDEFVDGYWFLQMFESLQAQGIEVFGFDDFKNFNYSPHTPQIRVKASSEIDWFDLEINFTVGDIKLSLRDVRKAVLAKEKYIKLGDGKLAILPRKWIRKLEKYLRIGKVEKDKVRISKLRFNALDDIFEELDQQEILDEIAEKKRRIQSFQKINHRQIPQMQATLRGYQEEGFHWMHFLHEFGWGGILADDMGLGKTLQMMTFLKSLKGSSSHNHLIVVPTSLLFNWQNEIEKFCPSLTYHIYHGSERERKSDKWEQFDLIITTYGLLVSEVEMFSKKQFGYVVLDESQAIKNPLSKRFKAAAVLKAQNRIVMTGTPVENTTFDLYAQMTFVNPGLFISIDHFRETYANPIDKSADQEVTAELNRMIHPFILRRTKEMVAKELPSKTEDVIYCQMEEEQRKVYEAFRNEYRNKIMGLIETEGLEKSKLHVLQALTKLRQICNAPALINEDSSYGNQSIKIKELVRHIREKTGNHKILVFSQFVKMLGLVRQELNKLDIPYTYLDGKTSKAKRKEEVETFQGQAEVRVFLISLRAGGTGLNLTAADYVYIVDPWWNPAVEDQAIDRCHRIGQDKKVIAYRNDL